MTADTSTEEHGRYRWAVLAVGTGTQTVTWLGVFAPVVLAPVLEERYGLGLTAVGLAIGSTSVGMTLTLLAWGLLADRVGERLVLVVGLAAAAGAMVAAAWADDFAWFLVWMVVFGMAGASTTSASTRAVVGWFPPGGRGLAFSVRQASLPVGALLAALALPALEDAFGLRGTLLVLAAACGAAALAAGVSLGVAPPYADTAPRIEPTQLGFAADPTLWRLTAAATLLVSPQMALASFAVVFFHEERGLSLGEAAAVLAGIRLMGLVGQLVAGAWADRRRDLVVPLRMLSLLFAATIVVAVVTLDAAVSVTAAAWIVAGGAALGWNGLSYAAVAEVAGYARSGAALGLQQTVLGVACFVTPIAFAAAVEATSWQAALAVFAAFPLAAYVLYRSLDHGLAVPAPRVADGA
ncbi:MAG: MFS transporter [Solirubrobacteraceae bacterium]